MLPRSKVKEQSALFHRTCEGRSELRGQEDAKMRGGADGAPIEVVEQPVLSALTRSIRSKLSCS